MGSVSTVLAHSPSDPPDDRVIAPVINARVRAENLMSSAILSAQNLNTLRDSLATNRRAVRASFNLLHDHADRAIAEVSRPRQRPRSRNVVRRRVDFCDRGIWYLHVRYARRHEPTVLNELVAHYQNDVDRQARRIGAQSSTEDLLQVAREALVMALHRFDPMRRKPFPPFARLTVDGTLRRYLRDQGYAIRPTRRIYELTPRLRQTSDWLTQEFGRPPTAGELADALGISTSEVLEAMASMQTRAPLSLDRPTGDDGQTISELTGSADPNLSRVLDRQAVRQLMKSVSADDRKLLDEYFLQSRTQQEIADARGVSQMHVSRALARILRRLRAVAATS
jgi:RNA polymerase sigma-B factor